MARIAAMYEAPIMPAARSAVDNLPRRRVKAKPEASASQPASPRESSAAGGDGAAPGADEAAGAYFSIIEAGTACTVCHDEFAGGDEVVELPCQHGFHPDCILPWLREVSKTDKSFISTICIIQFCVFWRISRHMLHLASCRSCGR